MDFSKWLSNTEGHFDRNLYVLSEYRKRNYSDCDLMVARTLTDAYAMLNKRGIKGEKKRIMMRLKKFYRNNEDAFKRVPDEKVKTALEASDRDACINQRDKDERPSFEDWLKKLQ